MAGKVGCVKTLLDHGSDINEYPGFAMAALVFLDNRERVNPYTSAIILPTRVTLDMAKILLMEGMDIMQPTNMTSHFDNFIRSSYIYPKHTNKLVYDLDRNNEFPLEIAIRSCNLDLVQLLWVAGCLRRKSQQAYQAMLTVDWGIEYDLVKAAMLTFITEVIHQPRSLTNCCAATIRQLLTHHVSRKIDQLNIPFNLKHLLYI